ncbi:hypothetical protein Goarm_017485 [Gossypium armourianum]|nr:hypothetical protein [Gossypium armourianum]
MTVIPHTCRLLNQGEFL